MEGALMSLPRHDVTIIGAGAVGSSLGIALPKNTYKIRSVFSARGKSAKALAVTLHADFFGTIQDDWEECKGIVFIAVPDDHIANVVGLLVHAQRSFRGTTVFHLSGALTSNVLKPLKAKGATIGSLHPLQTFTNHNSGSSVWRNIWIGIEGERKAAVLGKRIGTALHGHPFTIAAKQKTLYHVAAVFSSNYLVALLSIVQDLGRRAGLPKGKTLSPFTPLVLATFKNIENSSLRDALTGPIARGDIRTVRKHIAELSRRKMADILSVYISLGLQTAHLALQKKSSGSDNARRLSYS
jgi:predicted short-subunit dehydrogenase-like oxidoreductase (DUF2520 family)